MTVRDSDGHRFACVHAPDFPVQAAWHDETRRRDRRLAVLHGPESLLKVFACNLSARQAGVMPGMTRLQAEVCPGIKLRKRVVADEEIAQQMLLNGAFKFSFRVESTAPGTIILDLAGTERLFGSAHQIGQRIMEEYRDRFSLNVAVAANPDAAWCAALGLAGLTIIGPGREASRLAHLPVSVLPATPEVMDILETWGVRQFQTLAALPSIALSQRLGQQGVYLQSLALGVANRELIPCERRPCFRESMEIDEAIESLEPLGFVVNTLLQQLCQDLASRSLATDDIQIEMDLRPHSDRQLGKDPAAIITQARHQLRLKLPVPTQDPAVLLKLAQLELAARPPAAAVKRITIETLPARIRTEQKGLFQPLAPEPAQLQVTLARLRSVVGERDEQGRERVGFPVIRDSHRPDNFSVLPSFTPQTRLALERSSAPILALRIFRPPLPATVALAGPYPRHIRFNNTRAEIKRASGPWLKNGEWWSSGAVWNREEWDISLVRDGGAAVYRVFKECSSGHWFVEGIYD